MKINNLTLSLTIIVSSLLIYLIKKSGKLLVLLPKKIVVDF